MKDKHDEVTMDLFETAGVLVENPLAYSDPCVWKEDIPNPETFYLGTWDQAVPEGDCSAYCTVSQGEDGSVDVEACDRFMAAKVNGSSIERQGGCDE